MAPDAAAAGGEQAQPQKPPREPRLDPGSGAGVTVKAMRTTLFQPERIVFQPVSPGRYAWDSRSIEEKSRLAFVRCSSERATLYRMGSNRVSTASTDPKNITNVCLAR